MRSVAILSSVALLGACSFSTDGGPVTASDAEVTATAGSSTGAGGGASTLSADTGATTAGDAATSTSSAGTSGASTTTQGVDTELDTDDTDDNGGVDIGADAWLEGAPAGLIAGPELLELPSAPSGPPIWVSNNPERFTGDGWLVLHSRVDPDRGGDVDALAGSFPAYLFHLNGSGASRWLHIVATNPAPRPITVGARGSIYTNAEHPLNGPGTGPSFAVSADWLSGSLPIDVAPTAIDTGAGVVLLSRPIGANQMIDGRFEISASEGAFVYAVVTQSSAHDPAINATQGSPAQGEILSPGPNAYGREAGIYEHSEFISSVSAELPPGAGHLGFCFNTAAKFAWQGQTLQEQTAAARTILDDSADRTWGNYGHFLRVELELTNPGPAAREVSLALGSHFTADQDEPSFTWSAPMRVGPAGEASIVEVWTTPTAPVDPLGTWAIAADTSATLLVEVYVPGLITAGQQLQVIVE